MNTISQPQIRRFLYGMILLMIILSVLGVNNTLPVRAQEAWTATPTATTDTGEPKETVNDSPAPTSTPIATHIPTVILEVAGLSVNSTNY